MSEVRQVVSIKTPKYLLCSRWLQTQKSFFLCYRWALAMYFVFVCTFSIAASIKRGDLHYQLIYLTYWGLLLITIRMLTGALLVSHYCSKTAIPDEMTKWLSFYWLLVINSNVYSVIVTSVYWLAPATEGFDKSLNWHSFFVHISNSLAVVIEVFIVNHPSEISHFVFILPFGSAYLIFTLIYHVFGGVNK